MANPHDMLVKAIFGRPEHAAQYLEAVLPTAAARTLDLHRACLVPSGVVDQDLRHRHADLLYEVPLRTPGKPTPQQPTCALLYILFEHQSTPDPLMAFRLLRYMVRVWDRWLAENPSARRLQVIIPLVLYQGREEWGTSPRFQDLVAVPPGLEDELEELSPGFRFLLEELRAQPDRALPGTGVVRLTLLFLKHIRDPDLGRRMKRWVREIRAAADAPRGLQDLALVVEYVLQASDHVSAAELAGTFGRAGDTAREVPMSVADRLRAEGREEGLRKGRAEALLQSKVQLARKLIQRGMPVSEVADLVELDEAKVQELLAESDHRTV